MEAAAGAGEWAGRVEQRLGLGTERRKDDESTWLRWEEVMFLCAGVILVCVREYPRRMMLNGVIPACVVRYIAASQ